MICLKCKLPKTSSAYHYGLHKECFAEWFSVLELTEFTGLQRRSSTSSDPLSLTSQNSSFFQGKFKKYSAELGNNSYILKMRQEEAPELPEVEYLCNQIGQQLKIPVAEFYFIDFNGDQTFVTKNFITQGSPINLQHIYHFNSNKPYNCEQLIRIITEQTGHPLDIKIFVKTLLFDSLIGNHDRHGRNLAFIKTAKATSLSPIYDNVSYLSLESGKMLEADFNPAGKIATSMSNEPSMKDYVKELKKYGYQAELEEFYQELNLGRLNQLIDESFCSLLMKAAFKKLIRKRVKELEDELSI